MIRIASFALDALIMQGISVSSEQYQVALEETVKRMISGQHVQCAYPTALQAVINDLSTAQEK